MTPGRSKLVGVVLIMAVLITATTAASQPGCSDDPAILGAYELANAVSAYATHMGELPLTVERLSEAVTNARGVVAGPFIAPYRDRDSSWWRRYTYTRTGGHRFVISDGYITLSGEPHFYTSNAPRRGCPAP